MIEKVLEKLLAVSPWVKYGVYENEDTEVLTGLTETRKKQTAYLGGGNPEPLITVNVVTYAVSFIAGFNEALKLQNALKNVGYEIYEEIESDYDRQIGKYTIKFAICEN